MEPGKEALAPGHGLRLGVPPDRSATLQCPAPGCRWQGCGCLSSRYSVAERDQESSQERACLFWIFGAQCEKVHRPTLCCTQKLGKNRHEAERFLRAASFTLTVGRIILKSLCGSRYDRARWKCSSPQPKRGTPRRAPLGITAPTCRSFLHRQNNLGGRVRIIGLPPTSLLHRERRSRLDGL